tara:strand:+ start:1230 stop:1928 length:699 start_codon:yes stop_codon:yes gene_type:complete
MNKKISVLMSVFNDEQNIENSIKSILNQTYENYEFLIIDDGSTDKTRSICSSYANKYEKISLLLNEKNIGLTKSLNILISKASGYYVARQDSDDISRSTRFEKQIKFIEQKNLDGCSTKSFMVQKKTTSPKYSSYLNPRFVSLFKNPFIHGSLIIKRAAINKINNYNEDFLYTQDFKLTSDLINNGFKLRVLNEALYESNTVNNISSNYHNEQKSFAKKIKSENRVYLLRNK